MFHYIVKCVTTCQELQTLLDNQGNSQLGQTAIGLISDYAMWETRRQTYRPYLLAR